MKNAYDFDLAFLNAVAMEFVASQIVFDEMALLDHDLVFAIQCFHFGHASMVFHYHCVLTFYSPNFFFKFDKTTQKN